MKPNAANAAVNQISIPGFSPEPNASVQIFETTLQTTLDNVFERHFGSLPPTHSIFTQKEHGSLVRMIFRLEKR